MALTLDGYRSQLITSILFAGSQDEVKQFIEASTESFELNKPGEDIVPQFVDEIITELDRFSPMNKDAQQWSNITMARIIFNRIKHQHNATAG